MKIKLDPDLPEFLMSLLHLAWFMFKLIVLPIGTFIILEFIDIKYNTHLFIIALIIVVICVLLWMFWNMFKNEKEGIYQEPSGFNTRIINTNEIADSIVDKLNNANNIVDKLKEE